ncbi:MAG: hypothetical protein JNL58_11255 [Planctomyces sp.]|nr:hypothetical protein [Planctomyces sp.]
MKNSLFRVRRFSGDRFPLQSEDEHDSRELCERQGASEYNGVMKEQV